MSKLNSTLELLGVQPKNSEATKLGGSLSSPMMLGNRKYFIAVGYEETISPHFHVFRSEKNMLDFEHGACISLTSNKYVKHNMNREILTEKEIDTLCRYLKKKHIDTEITNWHMLIKLWNDNNSEQVKENIKMPTYNKYIR